MKEGGNIATKPSKNKTMAFTKRTKSKNKKNRKRFIAVDVWRGEFGTVSVRAIFDVYAQKFNVETHNMKNYSLQHCINALRLLEDPEYIKPKDISSY
jgi:hypothetical protein